MEHTINMNFNNELCNSIKNKNCKNLQCTHKKKNGELFCGIHLKSGNIEVYNPPILNHSIELNINENISLYIPIILNIDTIIDSNIDNNNDINNESKK